MRPKWLRRMADRAPIHVGQVGWGPVDGLNWCTRFRWVITDKAARASAFPSNPITCSRLTVPAFGTVEEKVAGTISTSAPFMKRT